MSKKQNTAAPRKTSWKQIFLRFICAILGLAIGCTLYIYKVLGGFKYVVTPIVSEQEYDTLELTSDGSLTGGDVDSSWADGGHTRVYVDPAHPIIEVKQKDKNVENILVFGVDSRGSDDYRCRSDAMMIVSINKKEDTIKVFSRYQNWITVTPKNRDRRHALEKKKTTNMEEDFIIISKSYDYLLTIDGHKIFIKDILLIIM